MLHRDRRTNLCSFLYSNADIVQIVYDCSILFYNKTAVLVTIYKITVFSILQYLKIRHSMKTAQEIILLFTKYPQPGTSKTRLIPAVGAEKAAEIQRQMTQFILGNIALYSDNFLCDLSIYFDGGTKELMIKWLGDKYRYVEQINSDLGSRMAMAIRENQQRYKAAVIIGSDCPDIDDTLIQQAFVELQSHEIVIGPAYDGGYYLIGMQTQLPRENIDYLFSDISWGSAEVLEQTITRIEKHKFRYHLLKRLHDIDTPEDLRYFDYNPDT